MAFIVQLVPRALCSKDAAAYLGLSERKFSLIVKFDKIPRQPDGAFSIKHLDEYQNKQEAAASCRVIELTNGDLARKDPKMDEQQDREREAPLVHVENQRGRRRQAGTGGANPWPDL